MLKKIGDHPLLVGALLMLFWRAISAVSLSGVFRTLMTVGSPLLTALALAFILNIPMTFFENLLTATLVKNPKTRLRRTLVRVACVLATLFSAAGAIAALVAFAVPQFTRAAIQLAGAWPSISRAANDLAVRAADLFPFLEKGLRNRDVLAEVTLFVNRAVGGDTLGIEAAVSLVERIAASVGRGGVSLILAVYILYNKERFGLHVRRALFAVAGEENATYVLRISRLAELRFAGFLKGQIAGAVVLGLLFLCVLGALGFPYALLISVFVSVTALVPIFGGIAGIAFGICITAVADPGRVLPFVLVYLLLQQLEDNLIYPRIVGHQVGLNGFWVLLSVTAGAALGGVAGILLAVPVTSVLTTIAADYVDFFLKEKDIGPEKFL